MNNKTVALIVFESVCMVALFVFLAAYFDKWWLALFAIFFISSVKTK